MKRFEQRFHCSIMWLSLPSVVKSCLLSCTRSPRGVAKIVSPFVRMTICRVTFEPKKLLTSLIKTTSSPVGFARFAMISNLLFRQCVAIFTSLVPISSTSGRSHLPEPTRSGPSCHRNCIVGRSLSPSCLPASSRESWNFHAMVRSLRMEGT